MRKLARGVGGTLDLLEFIGYVVCGIVAIYVAWRVAPWIAATGTAGIGVGAFLLARARGPRWTWIGAALVIAFGLAWLVYVLIFCSC